MKKNIIIIFLLQAFILKIVAQEENFVKDIDGNTYKTIEIGSYMWMAENLKTTCYNDGTEIPNIKEGEIWLNLKTGAYCWYNNDTSYAMKYGAFYNWYAVHTEKLCPEGWHVPTDEEWKYLEGFVDSRFNIGDTIWNHVRNRGHDAGLQLKATYGWKREGNGPDHFKFSALPGGERCSGPRFFQEEVSGFWWSSTEGDSLRAWYRNVFYDYELIFRETHPKYFGFSVRCVKENKL